MSVLIKGMKMPKHCGECAVEWCDRWKKLIIAGMSIAKSRPSDCPLIEIPPHGRLIDADELMKLFGMGADCHTLSNSDDGFRLKNSGMGADCYACQHGDSHGQCGFGPLFSDICEAIDNAPVIIEEEFSDG